MRRYRPEVVTLEGRALLSAGPVAPPRPNVLVGSANPTDHAAEQTLQSILNHTRIETGVPALAGGIIIDGKLAAVAASGVRIRGRALPVTVADQFNLGSVSKSMTATLAAILVERQTLRWDTTVGQTFPELRGKINPTYDNVTLRQLLDHRSGLPADEGLDPVLADKALAFRGPGPLARRQFLAPILASTPANPAGEMTYSNAGYVVAAAMIERATGLGYEGLMRKLVFGPLGMRSAGFGTPGQSQSHARPVQPSGHDEAGTPAGYGPLPASPPLIDPAGGIFMNMNDWSKFLRMQMGERVNGVRLLSDASRNALQTPDPRPIADQGGLLYGAGWVTVSTPLGTALWHNGTNGSWYAQQLLFPSKRAAVFVATNQGGPRGDAAVGQAVSALMARAFA